MMDFLKVNNHVTKEQYMWEWTVPQIKLASYDTTHIVSIPDKKEKKNETVINDGEDLLRMFGFANINKNIEI
ncbi:MAG: hypothetical protein ACRCX5_13325 [Bacteroidales bacterium]